MGDARSDYFDFHYVFFTFSLRLETYINIAIENVRNMDEQKINLIFNFSFYKHGAK